LPPWRVSASQRLYGALRRSPRWLQRGIRWARVTLSRLARRSRADLNIHLETARIGLLGTARENWLVPNPEWFPPWLVPYLRFFDRVLCKTRETERIFSARHGKCTYTGFGVPRASDPIDRHSAARKGAAPWFLHVAGNSLNKGTAALLELWRVHPEWPELVVVARPRVAQGETAENIIIRDDISDAELADLRNDAQAVLAPSEVEGFGHSIAESMLAGKCVVTLDAPPMNELVGPGRGYLLACEPLGRQRLATLYRFDAGELRQVVDRLSRCRAEDLEVMGATARDWMQRASEEFHLALRRAVEDIGR
jgi:hypothetical protein